MPSIGHIKAEVLVRVQGATEPSVVGYIEIPLHVSGGVAREGEAWAEVKPDFSTTRADLAGAIADAMSGVTVTVDSTRTIGDLKNRYNKEN